MPSNLGLFPSMQELEERVRCELNKLKSDSRNGKLTIQNFIGIFDYYNRTVRIIPISYELKDEWKKALSEVIITGSDDDKRIAREIQESLTDCATLKKKNNTQCGR